MIILISTCADPLHEQEFVQPIAKLLQRNNIEYKISHIKTIEMTELKGVDKMIICGTALADNAYLDHMHDLDFIATSGSPVLGICSGMQILAQVYGGSVYDATEIGMIAITVEDDGLLKNISQGYALHSLAATVPDGFIQLGFSENCAQIIKHKEKPHYGVLFHPEVRNEEIIVTFCK